MRKSWVLRLPPLVDSSNARSMRPTWGCAIPKRPPLGFLRASFYLAADIFLTAARFGVTPQSIVYPKRRCGALGGFLRA